MAVFTPYSCGAGRLGEDEKRAQTNATAKLLLAEVAGRLGNTVAVCRKSYVHPRVLALLTGEAPAPTTPPPRKSGLSAAERRFLAFLDASE